MPAFSRAFVFSVGVLLVLQTGMVDARVFMKIRGDADVIVGSVGGTRVYESDIEVNGLSAKLRAYGFKDASETVGAELLKRFGLDASAMREGAMVRLPERFGTSWLFVIPGMTGDVSSAILIEAGDSFESGTPQWIFPELPLPPGFSAEFSAVDKESRFVMSCGSVGLPSSAAISMVCGIFERDGWIAATPAKDKVSSILFAKGDNIALVCATPRDGGGSSLLVMKSKR